MDSTQASTEFHPEEEKTEEEILLDKIYDKEKPKQERAELIKEKLQNEREKFYELDFFLRNFYYHAIDNFNEKEDEPIFKDLTLTVLKDVISHDHKCEVNGVQTDVFNTTVGSTFFK